MTGYLTVLSDRNDVADAHGGTVKIHGLFQIELLIEFFQLLRHSARLPQRSSVNEVIIAAVYGNVMGLNQSRFIKRTFCGSSRLT